jgi:signal transduction histidine kinase
MKERIFERFVRGEQAAAGAPGTGLGLYISRQLAARHGGRLELDLSVPGHGSRFSLRLPRAAPRA